ncbi:MAG: putative ABC transporter permease subunit, partial [Caulobacteraceae bacterium]
MIRSATLTGLLAHELRLWARGWIRAKPKRWRLAIQGVFILLAFSCVAGFAGVPLGLWLARTEIGMTPMLGMIGAGAVSILFTLMLSQTLLGAVATLYERGDLDLLLSSPVQPSHVLTAKAAGMTVKAGTIFAILLSPLLIPVAILAHPEWLAAYGVLAALALASTAAGLWLSMLLFRTIGPRRTKTVAQLLAAIIGAAFFIVSQLQHLFGEDRAGSFWTRVVTDAQSGAMTVPAWVYWPTRAAFGEPGPLAAVLAAGAALFALAVATVGRSFAQDAAAASGAGASGRKTARGRGGEFSATPFQAVFRKEVRLLVRDPMLLSQVL